MCTSAVTVQCIVPTYSCSYGGPVGHLQSMILRLMSYSPVVLCPMALESYVLWSCVLWPYCLMSYGPRVLCPMVLESYVLRSYALCSCVLWSYCLMSYGPRVLSLCPIVLCPMVLCPMVYCLMSYGPRVLCPMVILSYVLWP